MMNERQKLVYVEQVRLIYSQLPTAFVGGAIIAPLFVWIFWNVSDHSLLIGLLVVAQSVLVARIVPYVGFNRRPDDDRIEMWGNLFVLFTFLQGSIWGAAWLLFLPAEDPVYNVVVAMWVIGMSAASVSAYTAHLKALLAFFVPVVVPGVAQLFIIGGQLHVALGLAICIYAIVVVRALLPIHRSMVAAIGLNFELEEEIQERKRMEEQLREISLSDGLTGLANRRHFDGVLETELQRAQRNAQSLSLVLIDIDDFKAFNDTYGHVKGDECLRRVSRLIAESVKRTGDLAARYGGDELALILPDTDAGDALRITDGIREAVRDLALPHKSSGIDGCECVTVSAGIATIIPDRDAEPSEIIQLADEALYRAKRSGRDRVVS